MYTEVPITIHIINSDPEEVNRRVDEILHGTNERRGIINTDMTQTEMAKAIHLWIFDTLSRSTTDRRAHSLTDEAAAALDTIRSGSNSRGYSSLASFMLTRVGIENIRVERIPEARSRHYWLLINIDDGWYHFDAFPTGVIPLRNETHKFTAKQAEDFAGRVKNWGFDKIDDYYTFVTTDDMPAIVQG
jgi:transglutaminase/protease-like cytokinesis protein 3